jgi:hypothetical protein
MVDDQRILAEPRERVVDDLVLSFLNEVLMKCWMKAFGVFLLAYSFGGGNVSAMVPRMCVKVVERVLPGSLLFETLRRMHPEMWESVFKMCKVHRKYGNEASFLNHLFLAEKDNEPMSESQCAALLSDHRIAHDLEKERGLAERESIRRELEEFLLSYAVGSWPREMDD